MKKVLVIGANSYIGNSFLKFTDSYFKRSGSIHLEAISASNGAWKTEDYSNYDTVLLLSGIVHRKENTGMEELYDKVNHRMAVKIAELSKKGLVKQFIFLSTAAVYGEDAKRITKDTEPNPTTLYGKSKLAAERDIIELQSDKFRVAILRVPMVYGEGCKGNYPRLVKLAKWVPIFPKLHNRRSMLHIDALCRFLYELIELGDGGYYYPQDDKYVDTCEFIVKLRRDIGKKTWLIRIFNPGILFFMKYNKSLHKMFDDCYYDMDYNGK